MDISADLLNPLRKLGAEQFSVVLNMVSSRDYRVYCDYPAEWQNLYFRTALYKCDPVFQMAEHLSQPRTWDEIARPFQFGNVIDMARDFGMTNGVTIPVQMGKHMHMVSLTLSGKAAPTMAHRRALLRASKKLVVTLDSQTEQNVSRMQSRIAFLAAQGMSPTQIADILTTPAADFAPPLDPIALQSVSLH